VAVGRKPTPPELKVLRGTLRKDDVEKAKDAPRFDVVEGTPPVPETLKGPGAAMWKDLTAKLTRVRVLQTTDLYVLEQLCYGWQRFQARAAVGDDISPTDHAALRALFSEFGMTPASRQRVAVSDKSTGNRFANNGKPPERP
jgi:phage terminase small subunit